MISERIPVKGKEPEAVLIEWLREHGFHNAANAAEREVIVETMDGYWSIAAQDELISLVWMGDKKMGLNGFVFDGKRWDKWKKTSAE